MDEKWEFRPIDESKLKVWYRKHKKHLMICGAVLLTLIIILTIVFVVRKSNKGNELVTAKNSEKNSKDTDASKNEQKEETMTEHKNENETKTENKK